MEFNMKYISQLSIPYEKKSTIRALLIIRKSNSAACVEKAKLDLFEMMHKIIYKNVNNYHYQAKIYKSNYLITEEEIISECYMVLDACIRNFVRKKDKWDCFVEDSEGGIIYDYSKLHKVDFYYYYNKSVTRTVYRRIIQKLFKKHNNMSAVDTGLLHDGVDSLWSTNFEPNELEFVEFDLQNKGLNGSEIDLILSRYRQEKAVEYMKRTKTDSNKYYNTLKTAREKWTN